MRTFCDDKWEPFKIKLVDRNGKEKELTAKFLSVKECKQISTMYKETNDDQSGEKSFLVLQEQMSFIFGGKKEDYEIYSPKLIKDVLAAVTKEILDPTIQVQEKKE
jgi:hypothetical protein